jgi:hypothetical protein
MIRCLVAFRPQPTIQTAVIEVMMDALLDAVEGLSATQSPR